MRVAVGPVDPAGTAGALVAGLREVGVEAALLLWLPPRGAARAPARVLGRAGRIAVAATAPARCDVVNYQSFAWLPNSVDTRWPRLGRALRIATFHGDDCRRRDLAHALFPSWKTEPDPALDAAVRSRVGALARVCDAAIVANLELATYVLDAFRRTYVVPAALAPASPPAAGDSHARPVVVHAPSDRALKGTAAIERTLGGADGFELRILEGRPHATVLRELAAADVVVDQVDSPSFGVVALEAMAAGKPVLCELDPAARPPYQRDLPIVPVTAETLAEEVEALVADSDRRLRLGEQGRRYVERHTPTAVARATLAVYEHARQPARGTLFEAAGGPVRRLEAEEATIRARLAEARER